MAQDKRSSLIQRGIVDFMIAHDLLSYQIEKALRPLELNLTQMSLLNHFSRQPDKTQTITELAKVMGINQPGVTKAVNALVDKGCLIKQDFAEDARIKLIKITQAGLNLLNQARAECYPTIEQAFGVLNDAELQAFTGSLNKIKTYLDLHR